MPGKLFSRHRGVRRYNSLLGRFCFLHSGKAQCLFPICRSPSKNYFYGLRHAPSVLAEYQKVLPQAMFMNHYGPTEITASCTYHILNTAAADLEEIPIGRPFSNTQILLLKSDGTVVPITPAAGKTLAKSVSREPELALGYYADAEKTASSFIQNPSNPNIPNEFTKPEIWAGLTGMVFFTLPAHGSSNQAYGPSDRVG